MDQILELQSALLLLLPSLKDKNYYYTLIQIFSPTLSHGEVKLEILIKRIYCHIGLCEDIDKLKKCQKLLKKLLK